MFHLAGFLALAVLLMWYLPVTVQIRQREAEQMRRHLVRSSETQKKLDMLSRLGALCRILNRYVCGLWERRLMVGWSVYTLPCCCFCSHFVTSKKVALPLEEVLQKLSESHSSELAKGSQTVPLGCWWPLGCWL